MRGLGIVAVVILAIIVLFSGFAFVVDETEQVVITRFGKPVREPRDYTKGFYANVNADRGCNSLISFDFVSLSDGKTSFDINYYYDDTYLVMLGAVVLYTQGSSIIKFTQMLM